MKNKILLEAICTTPKPIIIAVMILLITNLLGGNMLQIKYFGHSMWGVANDNVNIIIDPFNDIGFPMPENLTADIVITSHEHHDHNNFKLITPPFQKVTQIGTYTVKDARIKMIQSSHGTLEGRNLGDNYLSLITLDGVSMLHCGDLGVIPEGETLKEISDVDILFIPIGGKYTINAERAKEVITLVAPKIVFPMHYRVENSTVEIDSFEPFAKLFHIIEHIDSDVFSISRDTLPENMRIIKLNYE